jgi:hypothetical protein
MSDIFNRIHAHPQGAAVMRQAGRFLATQPDATGSSVGALMLQLATVAQVYGDSDFSETLDALAADDERSVALWKLLYAMAALQRTADEARVLGLQVHFEGDVRRVVLGQAGPESIKAVVSLTDAGRKVREQLDRESDDGEVTA